MTPAIWGFLLGFGVTLPFGFSLGAAWIRARLDDEQQADAISEFTHGRVVEIGE